MREALAADAVLELFATAEAMQRHPELTCDAAEISARDAAALSETVTPQGLVAVCRLPQPDLEAVLRDRPALLAATVDCNEPGNLGAIIRTADAAGAAAVICSGGVDPHNGKVIRATAGSLFHLPVVPCEAMELLDRCARAGISTLATTGGGSSTLDELIESEELARPSAWLFGNEAHGLPAGIIRAAERSVRVPIYGRAESLNLAATAAICLYASARQARPTPAGGRRAEAAERLS
ncbi:MAG TPA: RNA methyltransferase [Jatrophihabitans sp.]|nr:RNA methyltransferase [Jatrophihabitans sp.]